VCVCVCILLFVSLVAPVCEYFFLDGDKLFMFRELQSETVSSLELQ
jgi:hypothetical protein